MGLSSEELDLHCRQILGSRRIKNKIVVLCEGNINDISGRLSPQAYKNMDCMPDANFYKKCVPKAWNNKPKPQFFNCGDRQDVIDTYIKLLELDNPGQTYMNKTKLFALVDLDIQVCKIDQYQFLDTEQIFNNLYRGSKVSKQTASNHFIWVTGLIHKEAYFITPNIQTLFDSSLLEPKYNGQGVLLGDLYFKICNDSIKDKDLKNHFNRVIKRIGYCQQLNCCNIEELTSSWKEEFTKPINEQKKREIVFSLLTVRKAKQYWNQIEPPNYWTKESERFREQLSLEIGEFYSRLDWQNPDHHIPFFFYILFQLA